MPIRIRESHIKARLSNGHPHIDPSLNQGRSGINQLSPAEMSQIVALAVETVMRKLKRQQEK